MPDKLQKQCEMIRREVNICSKDFKAFIYEPTIMCKLSKETIDYCLKATWQRISNKYNLIAAEFGITQAMGYVLINVHKTGVTVSQLAADTGVKATSLSRLLKNLEEKGVIYRKENESDKRSVMVFLTPLGIEKRKVAKGIVKDFNRYLQDHFEEDELNAMYAILRKLNGLVDAYLPPIKDTKEELEKINELTL